MERDDEGVPFGIRHSGGYYVAVDTEGPRITALRLLDEAPSRYRPDSTADEGTVVMRYAYDASGNLTEVVNSSGEPLRFAYDAEGASPAGPTATAPGSPTSTTSAAA